MSCNWTISVDHFPDADAAPGTNCNAVGIVGPRSATMTHDEIMKHPESRAFRMLDDDGELMYSGRIVGGDGFEPLDNFGTPNAGATEIQYHVNGRWETL